MIDPAGDDIVENGRPWWTASDKARRRWVLVVGAILLAGGGLATSGALRGDPPVTPVTSVTPVTPAPSIAIVIFLDADATADQKDAIGSYLDGLRVDGAVRFEAREDAYRRVAGFMTHQPDPFALTSPEALPDTYRLTLADRADLGAVKVDLAGLPGVAEVWVPSEMPTP